MEVMEPPSWDDRKELSDIWQEHAPLPDIGMREGIYQALIAVASWGYSRNVDAGEPVEKHAARWGAECHGHSHSAKHPCLHGLYKRGLHGGSGGA